MTDKSRNMNTQLPVSSQDDLKVKFMLRASLEIKRRLEFGLKYHCIGVFPSLPYFPHTLSTFPGKSFLINPLHKFLFSGSSCGRTALPKMAIAPWPRNRERERENSVQTKSRQSPTFRFGSRGGVNWWYRKGIARERGEVNQESGKPRKLSIPKRRRCQKSWVLLRSHKARMEN